MPVEIKTNSYKTYILAYHNRCVSTVSVTLKCLSGNTADNSCVCKCYVCQGATKK